MSINNLEQHENNERDNLIDQNQNEYDDYSTIFRSHTTQNSSIFNGNIHISTNANENNKFSFRKLWKFTGPGFLMSIAYLDPGNLESDLQSGASAGYKLLWALLYSTIIGFLMQMLAVRLGSTTGLHLAQICHKEYTFVPRYFLWIMIEIAIICSDIQQVIGSALAINLLSRGYIPIWIAILITGADTFIFLFIENTGLRLLEAVFGVFITVMSGTFLYMYIRVEPDQKEVVNGVLYPWCSNCTYLQINQLVGIVGSIIMPHNIYFHSTLVLSRNIDRRNENSIHDANKYYAIESAIALFISFLCNLFVTSTFSKAFYDTDKAANVTLVNAGQYIYTEYGLIMQIIWAIGLLSAGQSSTMTGTYAGQFVMEGFTKINLSKWKRILITRSISIIPAVIIAYIAVDSIDKLNFWCNIIQAIQLPFALIPVIHFTSSKRIMGQFKINLFLRITCYTIAALIIGVNFYIFFNLIIHTNNILLYILFAFILFFYVLVLTYYLLGVNNIYRIKLFIRKLCCIPYATEIDELLHAAPVYRRPQKQIIQQQDDQTRASEVANFATLSNFSLSNNHLNTSINRSTKLFTKISTTPEPIIA